jgi:small subunit ribosomal protein S16
MAIRLRLALHGTRHRRIFHLVAIHNGRRRDAKPTETLGIYDPHMTTSQTHKTIEWSVDRIRYWLHVGAVPSKSVSKLLEMVSPFSLIVKRADACTGRYTQAVSLQNLPECGFVPHRWGAR